MVSPVSYAKTVLNGLINEPADWGFPPHSNVPYVRYELSLLEMPLPPMEFNEADNVSGGLIAWVNKIHKIKAPRHEFVDNIKAAITTGLNEPNGIREFEVEVSLMRDFDGAPLEVAHFFIYADPEKTAITNADDLRTWLKQNEKAIVARMERFLQQGQTNQP